MIFQIYINIWIIIADIGVNEYANDIIANPTRVQMVIDDIINDYQCSQVPQ